MAGRGVDERSSLPLCLPRPLPCPFLPLPLPLSNGLPLPLPLPLAMSGSVGLKSRISIECENHVRELRTFFTLSQSHASNVHFFCETLYFLKTSSENAELFKD